MASKYKERIVKLRSKDCPGYTYYTTRNKKKIQEKLVLMKYCPVTRKKAEFKEIK